MKLPKRPGAGIRLSEDDVVDVLMEATGLDTETEQRVAPSPPCIPDAVHKHGSWRVSVEAKSDYRVSALSNSIKQCMSYTENGWPAYAAFPEYCINKSLVEMYDETDYGLVAALSAGSYTEIEVEVLSAGTVPEFESLLDGAIVRSDAAKPASMATKTPGDKDWREALQPVRATTAVAAYDSAFDHAEHEVDEVADMYAITDEQAAEVLQIKEALERERYSGRSKRVREQMGDS